MGFVATPNTVRCDIQFVCYGQQMHNVIWVEREAPWTQTQREDLNDAIAAWWSASGRQNYSGYCSLVQITTVNQDTANAPSSTLVVTPAVAGTAAGAACSNNVSHCATLRTDFRGRSFRGRFYAGGLPVSSTTDAITFSTQAVTNIITMLTALKTAIDALTAIWVIVSKWSNKVQRAQGLTTNVTAISVDQYIDSQRRRLGLRGV